MTKKFTKKDFTATNILIIITVLSYIVQINIPKGGLLFGLNLYFLIYDLVNMIKIRIFILIFYNKYMVVKT
jgi:hypothetical protein